MIAYHPHVILNTTVAFILAIKHDYVAVQVERVYGQVEDEKCRRHDYEHLGDLARDCIGLGARNTKAHTLSRN
jgi:hypothetical protein